MSIIEIKQGEIVMLKKNCFSIICKVILLFACSTLFINETHAAQTDILGPVGSGQFGGAVTVLPNGNIVVIDRAFFGFATSAGAVHLYDGASLALISTIAGRTNGDLVGSGGITVLTNGDFVVISPTWDNGAAADVGAVTLCSATSGCPNAISATNSFIGTLVNDQIGSGGVTALTNGNYVISSPNWDGSAANTGAVTFCNGATGCTGTVTLSNSIFGNLPNNQVGSGGVTALTNGNYVVRSPNWDRVVSSTVVQNVGAVTFCNGTTGCAGEVLESNSLVGSTINDNIGSQGITALKNGNFVVRSTVWDNGAELNAGAVTWCSGTSGCAGAVSDTNSLVGSLQDDIVGAEFIVELTNSNFVVSSANWHDSRGAATWCSGTSGCTGIVNALNSLVGVTPGDLVGNNGITPLTNGNYVVNSPFHDGGAQDTGAATWCNGASGGCVGPILSGNSLVGTTANNLVGLGGTTALTNGNYVVRSYLWDGIRSNVGAATFCNGTSGCTGAVTQSNSLIGTLQDDQVGFNGITALTNGNFVVASSTWGVGGGAVTWCSGTSGCTGEVTFTNSLFGFIHSIEPSGVLTDQVGAGGVTALTNGNYVVNSPNWNQPGLFPRLGAVTLCDGATGCAGPATHNNSLIGAGSSDLIGSSGIVALANGNFVVRSPLWDHATGSGTTGNAGAVTWCSGIAGSCIGVVSPSNSLIGSNANDMVGNDEVVALSNGHYIVRSATWDIAFFLPNAGAVALGNGARGTFGQFTSANSVLGDIPNGGGTMNFTFDHVRNRLVVGYPAGNRVSLLYFNYTAIASGNWNDITTWDTGMIPDELANVIIPSGITVTLNTNARVGTFNARAGSTFISNADLEILERLLLETRIDMGAHTLGLGCAATVSGASESNYIMGNLEKDFCRTEAFNYPVGTMNGYSPVNVNVTGLTANPSSLLIKANQGVRAGMDASQSAQRYWTLHETGALTADVTFNYRDGDVIGAESNYKLYRFSGSASLIPSILNTSANTISATGISDFSDWAIGNLAPTAASVKVGGRVTDSFGIGLSNVRVTLTAQNGETQTALTNAFGYYHFEDVQAGQTYIFSASSKRYRFAAQVLTVIEDFEQLNFIASP